MSTETAVQEIKEMFSEIERLKNELQEYKKTEETNNFEDQIYDMLYQLQIPASIKGFRLIVEAIKELYGYDDYKITALYNVIAKKLNDTPARVERAIRHAIESGWYRSEEGFGILNKHLKRNPTNSEFLWLTVNYLRRNRYSVQ